MNTQIKVKPQSLVLDTLLIGNISVNSDQANISVALVGEHREFTLRYNV